MGRLTRAQAPIDGAATASTVTRVSSGRAGTVMRGPPWPGADEHWAVGARRKFVVHGIRREVRLLVWGRVHPGRPGMPCTRSRTDTPPAGVKPAPQLSRSGRPSFLR